MPLHWGLVKPPDILAVGIGTYRGKITKRRGCVAGLEDFERIIVFEMPKVLKNEKK